MSTHSRQLSYQMRHKQLGLCIKCPRPRFKGRHCKEHYEEHLARNRERYQEKKVTV